MLFEPGIFLAAAATVSVALLDRIAEDCGFSWLSTTLKLIIPIAAIIASAYFLENNPFLRWIK